MQETYIRISAIEKIVVHDKTENNRIRFDDKKDTWFVVDFGGRYEYGPILPPHITSCNIIIGKQLYYKPYVAIWCGKSDITTKNFKDYHSASVWADELNTKMIEEPNGTIRIEEN